MNIKIFIRSFYVFQFLFDFILIYAVEKLFFLDRGINLTQIGILLTLWSAMTIIFEIPTGIIADRWSRRKMLILSGIFFSACYFIWIFGNSFWIFLFGFLLRTLGSTFSSGTLQAYTFEFLKLHNKESEFEKIWGQGNSLRTLGIGCAVILGGLLSQISYILPLILSAVSILMISAIAYIWPEIRPTTSLEEKSHWKFIKSSIKTISQNYTLAKIALFSLIIFSIFSNLEEYNDVYLKFLGYPNALIGAIFAVATIGQSIASATAHHFKKHSWLLLNLSAIIGIIILFSAYLFRNPIMAIGILLLGIMLEFSRILNEGIIQREISENKRATVASLNSLVSNIIPFQLIFGFVADKYNLQSSYATLGILAISYFLILPFIKNHYSPPNDKI